MDKSTLDAERTANILFCVEEYINYLSNIYKCYCDSCITSNTKQIISLIDYILSFYKFITKHKTIIKQNNKYLIQIQTLLTNMIKFNNEIIHDILYTNIEKSISIIYLEQDTIINYEQPIQIIDLIKYYPEYRLMLEA